MTVRDNIEYVRSRIEEAARRSGRSGSDVRLVAVTKGVPVERIQEAIGTGASIFGENYIQEGTKKIEALGKGILWHMIGNLQRNKARDAIDFFDVIETVDTVVLAKSLDRHAAKRNSVRDILVQVNLSGEETKHGVHADEVFFLIDDIITNRHNLRFLGLMMIPPFFEDPVKARPYFAALRELGNAVESRMCSGNTRLELSMGMSGDFEVAIEEGATIVRIGSAIFGPRTHI